MEDILNDFLAEANDQINQVERQIVLFEQEPSNADIIASIFRLFHTLKGTSGFLDLPRLERISHAAETLLGQARDHGAATPEQVDLVLQTVDIIQDILAALAADGREPVGTDDKLIAALEAASEIKVAANTPENQMPCIETIGTAGQAAKNPAQQPDILVESRQVTRPDGKTNSTETSGVRETGSIRVALGTIERIMRLVSELVLTRNQLMDLSRSSYETTINAPLQRLSAITSDLQDSIMRARMQPIDRLFSSLPRIARELAHDLNKRTTLILEGSDTELDRQLIELIRDPLMHILRNCIDHGLESEAERLSANKSATGTIKITAAQESGFISIRISDDGRGVDVARVRQKALDLGLADSAQLAAMSKDEVCRFIFAPGFSTAQAVTNVSGRGVGMDVVRENVESIGGTVSLSTTPGQGTTITLKIPLTLAIVPALIFKVHGFEFAIPQDAVLEAVAYREDENNALTAVQGRQMFTLRDQVMPVVDMAQLCNLPDRPETDSLPAEKIFIISRIGAMSFAISVDALADVQEIVVKPLSSPLAHLDIFAGNTILGNGAVVLIVNPVGLASAIGLDSTNQYTVNASGATDPYRKDATNFILFRGNGPVQKALPLSLLSRIEEVDAKDIAESEGQKFLKHNGLVMPVLDLAGFSSERARWPVLVVGVGGEPMGLIVSQIIDTVEHALEIDIAGHSPAVVGSTTINGELTEILDLSYFMQLARPDAFARRHAHRFRILVVDDKPFFRDMLAPIIAASGYEVSTASSAEDAISLIRRGGQFDAILTDVDMPNVNGYELTAMIREIPVYKDKPIIALDAYAGQEVKTAAQAAGMTGVVGKFDRKSLIERLQECLESSAFTSSAIEASMKQEHAA